MKPATVRKLPAGMVSDSDTRPDADGVAQILAAIDAMRAEMLGIRADLRELRRDELACALREAIEQDYGDDCPFTVRSLLAAARMSPETILAHVLKDLLDMSLPERSVRTQLGRLLARQPWVKAEGKERGSAIYYLIDYEDDEDD